MNAAVRATLEQETAARLRAAIDRALTEGWTPEARDQVQHTLDAWLAQRLWQAQRGTTDE
jgi:hypothetical protein